MALRISLILALLAGLGVIGVSQFVLRPHFEEIVTTRDHHSNQWHKTTLTLNSTKKELDQTKNRLAATEKNLEDTKTQLTAMTAKADSQEKRANGLDRDLAQTRQTLKVAQDKLEQWRGVGMEPPEVLAVIASEGKLKLAVAALTEENALAVKKWKDTQKRLEEIIGGREDDPPVPREVRGTVKVVDPKWDFVILDVGANKNIPPRGILLVSRNGELIAKVRVMAVEEQRSVANVLPGWKLKDIMEGDSVLPY